MMLLFGLNQALASYMTEQQVGQDKQEDQQVYCGRDISSKCTNT